MYVTRALYIYDYRYIIRNKAVFPLVSVSIVEFLYFKRIGEKGAKSHWQ